MPELKDAPLAAIGASAALSGLLLVFMGFVYLRGESFQSKRGDKFKIVAKVGIAPFLLTIACTWPSLEWLLGANWAYSLAILLFRISLAATALYGTVTMMFYL